MGLPEDNATLSEAQYFSSPHLLLYILTDGECENLCPGLCVSSMPSARRAQPLPLGLKCRICGPGFTAVPEEPFRAQREQ
jgi:hypothetical protein